MKTEANIKQQKISIPKTRAQALDHITALCKEFDLSAAEISARLTRTPKPTDQTNLVQSLFAYIGGIFVFAGLGALTTMIWDDIGSAQRVIITFGTGLIAFVLGFLADRDQRFQRAATPLFLVAAFLQPLGIFVFLDEYIPPSNDPQLAVIAVSAIIGLQFLASFLKQKRSSLLFLAFVFWAGFIGTSMNWLGVNGNVTALTVGLSLLGLSYGTDKTPHRNITPFWYFWATLLVLGGFFDLVENTPFSLFYLGVNAGFIYLAIKAASRTMLFVSVIGLLAYLGYFTTEYFADVIGWPVALIVMGLTMIAIGGCAFKLDRKIRQT